VMRDPVMQDLRRTITRVAPSDANILVLGETGVGKDVVASLVHQLSPRQEKPFLRLNCACLTESLIESELFGHEKGAFTGATATKPGLIESAEGGTVFLDEIGELPLSIQAKLLRTLESRELLRVGSVRPRTVDVRFVAATNRDLDTEVEAGRFRRDLLYRLNTIRLQVPPLRARPSDISALAQQFLENACERFGLGPRSLSDEAVQALVACPWPGNVRELRNVIERSVLLSDDPVLRAHHLDLARPLTPTAPAAAAPMDERERILDALTRCGGNQSRAAELLDMPRRTFVRRLAELDIPRPRGS
jgi:two-component system, NtrC family, response regulator AtoC